MICSVTRGSCFPEYFERRADQIPGELDLIAFDESGMPSIALNTGSCQSWEFAGCCEHAREFDHCVFLNSHYKPFNLFSFSGGDGRHTLKWPEMLPINWRVRRRTSEKVVLKD
jgi:hypothetical protein